MNDWSTTLLLLATVVLLGGCAAPKPTSQQRATLEGPALALQSQGAYREAAVAWQQAAVRAGDSELALLYRLNSADALISANDSSGAQSVVATLPARLPPDLAIRRALIGADIALLDGNAARALRLVGPAIETRNMAILRRYRFTRAEALLLSGDVLGSARELAMLDGAIDSPQLAYGNRQRIWERLGEVAPAQLASLPQSPPEPFSGWVELANLARNFAIDPDALDAAIARWTLRYPGHPAGEQIVPELQERARAESQPPSKVALLLPQSGPYAGAGASIRDGFMAAWFADAPNPRRPQVAVMDTGAMQPEAAYLRAVDEGAQLVVGPLTKEAVSAVLRGTRLPVTTIALNYPANESMTTTGAQAMEQAGQMVASASGGSPGDGTLETARRGAYFFALSPEDEAARAADYARSLGAVNAGILAPDGQWGERVAKGFSTRWRSIGGSVAAVQLFPEEPAGLSEAVKNLLNINASSQRARDLQRVIARRMEFDPSPRTDLDVIFLAAFPADARQVRPLLAFHRSEHTPVVATSHMFSGTPDPDLDQDVEGVVFGDMPWLITPELYGLPEQVKNALPDSRGTLARLYAFGADAYALIGQLPKLRGGVDPFYPGLTGKLSLGPGQRIRRDLEWARFQGGRPVPVSTAGDAAHSPPPGPATVRQ